jgi:hypothetical protein
MNNSDQYMTSTSAGTVSSTGRCTEKAHNFLSG